MSAAPLSYAQQLMAAFAVNDGGSVFGAGFLNWAAFRLTGPLDVPVLRSALDDLVARQTGLRTVVVRDEGFPYQAVRPAAPVRLEVRDDPAVTAADRLAAVARTTARALGEPQPADEVPLLRAHLVRFDDRESALVLLIHRTVADGWTLQLGIRDTMAGYERLLAGTAAPGVLRSYVDRARADAEPTRERQIRDNLPYWRERLGAVTSLGLTADVPREPGASGPKALYTFELPDGTVAGLRRSARALRTSLFTLLFTAYGLALAGQAGTDAVVVPVLHTGRDRADWDTIGFFVDGHVHRLDFGGDPTLAEAVDRVRDALLAAQVHDVPLIRVLEELPNLADIAFDDPTAVAAPIQLCHGVPDFDVEGATVRYDRLKLPPDVVREEPVMPVDFLWVMEPYTSFVVRVTYNPRLLRAETVTSVADRFRRTVDALVAAPSTPVGDLLGAVARG